MQNYFSMRVTNLSGGLVVVNEKTLTLIEPDNQIAGIIQRGVKFFFLKISKSFCVSKEL